MRKKKVFIVLVLSVLLILSILFSQKKDDTVRTHAHYNDSAVLELLLETTDGDIIDPTFAFIHQGDDFYFQCDGLLESSEILGLDDTKNKTKEDLIGLDEFFDILATLDGEWVLVKYDDNIEEKLNFLILHAKEISSISSVYLPESYIMLDDLSADHDMAKFTEMFYNIINERFIER